MRPDCTPAEGFCHEASRRVPERWLRRNWSEDCATNPLIAECAMSGVPSRAPRPSAPLASMIKAAGRRCFGSRSEHGKIRSRKLSSTRRLPALIIQASQPYGGISIVTTTPPNRRVIITQLGVRLTFTLTPRLLSYRIASVLISRGVSAFGRNSMYLTLDSEPVLH